ncbi:MAG: alpha/beta hydrolase [Actinobacteria bacterium]|nr:alpha/beta hydrolase [Actinomycetota bacterium]
MLIVALYLIGALLLVTIAVNLALGRLPKQPPMPGERIHAGGRHLHYIERPGEGMPVVLIHGMPSLALDYVKVMDELSGARLIAFDRPGYGWSKGGPLPFDRQIEAVREALLELGAVRAIFVGHSYGAVFSLAMAERHPEMVEALVLASPAAGGTRVSPSLMRQARWIQRLQLPVIRHLADLLFLRTLRRFAAERGALASYGPDDDHAEARTRAVSVLAHHDSIAALMNDRLEFNQVNRELHAKIDQVRAPATIIHGTGDRTVPLRNARRLDEALKRSKLREVEGTHILLDTHPEIVAGAVREYLRENRKHEPDA